MGVIIFNRMPLFLLGKNAFFRGNVGFVGAYMLVSAFLGYVDGRGQHEILLDLLLGGWLCYLAVKAFRTEARMYKYIWGETYYRMQKILLCDAASLSEEEAEIKREYAQGKHSLSFEQQVTMLAVDVYLEKHKTFEERYEKEHRILVLIGNGALLLIILNIVYNIVTHI